MRGDKNEDEKNGLYGFVLCVGVWSDFYSSKSCRRRNYCLVKSPSGCCNPFAIGSFSMSIPAKSQAMANSSFSLAAGETVTIKASYYPFSASVDVGLVAPDGKFYYFNITNGSIDKTIQVSESGKYTLMVRNNSSNEIEVSGFVNY